MTDQDEKIDLTETSSDADDKFFDEELDVIEILREVEKLGEENAQENELVQKLSSSYEKLDAAGKKMLIEEIRISLDNSGKEISPLATKVYKEFFNKYKGK